MNDPIALSSLPNAKRELLLRTVYDALNSRPQGLSTVAVHHSVFRHSRRIGFEPTLAVITEALTGMHERGAVSREDGPVVTLWRAVRAAPNSSHRQVSG